MTPLRHAREGECLSDYQVSSLEKAYVPYPYTVCDCVTKKASDPYAFQFPPLILFLTLE